MVELGKIYFKEQETRTVHEVTFFDERYMSVETISLMDIFKRFCTETWFYLTKKTTIPKKALFEAINVNAKPIFEEHNKFREEANIPRIDYEEFFTEEQAQPEQPNYFG